MFYVQRLTNGLFHWPSGLLSYKVETVPDLCFIALVFSRQLETFSTQHLRGLNCLETRFFFLTKLKSFLKKKTKKKPNSFSFL